MTFASREAAGLKLAKHLRESSLEVDLVVGLPRGGVVVAAAVAHELNRPLEALVVRKIGHPFHREFAIGALAENGVAILNENIASRNAEFRSSVQQVIAEESARLAEYQTRFHPHGRPDFENRAVLLVDDGLATGLTTKAAVLSARKRRAGKVIVAAPVASLNAVELLESVADKVIALFVDADFDAVGRYYQTFSQTSDQEVIELLSRAY